jgi:predicted phosphodiesterase
MSTGGSARDANIRRAAAIYDIHGNLPALEAVLDGIRAAGVDEVIVGGDVFPGPLPQETLDRLLALALPVRFLHGNGDREVLERMQGMETDAVPEPFREVLRWVARQLPSHYASVLAGWPPTRRLRIEGLGTVLFCHATPRNDMDIFTRLTPEDRLRPLFEGLGADVVVCGHTHMPFDRTIGTTRVVNAGSVGMPFGAPGADWMVLGPSIEPRHTSYDLEGAARRIRATAYPQAEEFAARYVLQPPTEAQMLEAFARAELK